MSSLAWLAPCFQMSRMWNILKFYCTAPALPHLHMTIFFSKWSSIVFIFVTFFCLELNKGTSVLQCAQNMMLTKIIYLSHWVRQAIHPWLCSIASPSSIMMWLLEIVHSFSLPYLNIIWHSASRVWSPSPAYYYFLLVVNFQTRVFRLTFNILFMLAFFSKTHRIPLLSFKKFLPMSFSWQINAHPIAASDPLAAIFNCVFSLLLFASNLLCRPDDKLAVDQIHDLHLNGELSRGKPHLICRAQ